MNSSTFHVNIAPRSPPRLAGLAISERSWLAPPAKDRRDVAHGDRRSPVRRFEVSATRVVSFEHVGASKAQLKTRRAGKRAELPRTRTRDDTLLCIARESSITRDANTRGRTHRALSHSRVP